MKNFNFDVFCDRFNSLIEGKSQLELSKEMNLSQPVISKLKKHTGQAPSADTVVRIANHFGVSTDWLLGLTDVKSTDKATKELCDTLGLSEQSIECLQDKTDEYAKKSIDWLIAQHINSIADKVKMFKEDLAKNNGAGLRSIPKDELLKTFGFLDNSILYNLYSLLALENEHADIILRISSAFINFSMYSNEMEFSTQNIDLSEREIKLPNGVFDYKGVICAKHRHAIFREIELLIDTIMEKQECVKLDKAIDIIKQMSSNQEEQPNGNDKKEE